MCERNWYDSKLNELISLFRKCSYLNYQYIIDVFYTDTNITLLTILIV